MSHPDDDYHDFLRADFDFLSDIHSDVVFFNNSFYGVSFENTFDITIDGAGGQRVRHRHTRRANRTLCIESVKDSCWYTKFTCPGDTRKKTLKLFGSDRYGEFRHWIQMPLWKVIHLTDILIDCGFVTPPRSLSRWAEF